MRKALLVLAGLLVVAVPFVAIASASAPKVTGGGQVLVGERVTPLLDQEVAEAGDHATDDEGGEPPGQYRREQDDHRGEDRQEPGVDHRAADQ